MKKARENIEKKRPFYLKRILISFILTCIIFILIFSFTMTIDYMVSQKTDKRINDFEKSIENLENLSDNYQCNLIVESESKEILNDAIYKIGFLEEKFGKNDVRVLNQKKYYSQLQYKHYLLLKELNKKCRKNTVFLFFIYDNSDIEEIRQETNRMSFILGNYYSKNREEVMPYSIDYNLKLDVINNLINEYNITSAPILLNPETGKTIKPNNVDELESFLKDIKNETK